MPTHKRPHASDDLSVTSPLREFLISILILGLISVWGAVPEVVIHRGTRLTLQIFLTIRLQVNSTSTRRQNSHWEPQQAGWPSLHREPQQAGWYSAGSHQYQDPQHGG